MDLNVVGIPPIPPENAEWMGHTVYSKSEKILV
jgi:hypothetical protein